MNQSYRRDQAGIMGRRRPDYSASSMPLAVTLFTDPACPFAFSAEPQRLRLRWHYGEGLEWRTRMIVLTREEREAKMLSEGAPGLQRKYGMPIDPAPYPRPSSSEPACLAVVAAHRCAPAAEEALLRSLRVRRMAGGLIDDPVLIDSAARDAGIDPEELAGWVTSVETAAALEADVAAARSPAPAAHALDHKLGGPATARRYSAPSYEIRDAEGAMIVVPGFNPIEAYEVAVANLSPALERRPLPGDVGELLDWAPYPLATVEVMAITGLHEADARAALAAAAEPIPSGADFFWRLPPQPAPAGRC
jgi:predicted DsbA family dithiol-disulfide isomerase